ncbi:MAG: aminoacyl-tRNA hydrolase [Marinilabiliaceae bacterium]|nr:aminoacyl-tRNA hydrolase [Marinilabiliaceae bacterium]
MKYLVVGLGNIGEEYSHTRHNIGFDIVSALAHKNGAGFEQVRHGEMATYRFRGNDVFLLKPNTYMNLSGKAVNYWLQQERIPIENLFVCVDDLALPLGTLRLKGKGSDGGHNGLKSINALIGTQNYARLRFGIGSDFHRGEQCDFVLGRWSDDEQKIVEERIEIATQIIPSWISVGLQLTMTQFNNK